MARTLHYALKKLAERLKEMQEIVEGTEEVVPQTTTTFEDLDLYFAFDDEQKFKLVLKLLKYYWFERDNLSFGFSYIYISYPW